MGFERKRIKKTYSQLRHDGWKYSINFVAIKWGKHKIHILVVSSYDFRIEDSEKCDGGMWKQQCSPEVYFTPLSVNNKREKLENLQKENKYNGALSVWLEENSIKLILIETAGEEERSIFNFQMLIEVSKRKLGENYFYGPSGALINFYGSRCAMPYFSSSFHPAPPCSQSFKKARKCNTHSKLRAFLEGRKRVFHTQNLTAPKGFREREESYGRAIYYYFLLWKTLLAFMSGWCGLKMAGTIISLPCRCQKRLWKNVPSSQPPLPYQKCNSFLLIFF